jgi:hypothetical protein
MTARALATAGAVLVLATPALAAFGASVATSGTSFGAYAVQAPTGLRCAGLSSLTTSRIEWDAVAPPAGQTVDYLVTQPSGTTVATSATSHPLPVVTLPGQWAVRARISSGWRSPAATVTVRLTALGLLYLCNVP